MDRVRESCEVSVSGCYQLNDEPTGPGCTILSFLEWRNHRANQSRASDQLKIDKARSLPVFLVKKCSEFKYSNFGNGVFPQNFDNNNNDNNNDNLIYDESGDLGILTYQSFSSASFSESNELPRDLIGSSSPIDFGRPDDLIESDNRGKSGDLGESSEPLESENLGELSKSSLGVSSWCGFLFGCCFSNLVQFPAKGSQLNS